MTLRVSPFTGYSREKPRARWKLSRDGEDSPLKLTRTREQAIEAAEEHYSNELMFVHKKTGEISHKRAV